MVHKGDEFVVVEIPQSLPKMGLSQEAKMGEQLGQAHIRGQRPDFG
jgi:hypothetical protein